MAWPWVRAEVVRVVLERRKSEGCMSRGSHRQRSWWTPVSPTKSMAGCGEVTISRG